MMDETYRGFYSRLTGNEPYPYQERLGVEPWPDLLDIPTGLGKTAAVVVAWLWKRVTGETGTPRRLVYCLPMRVLVEQTWQASLGWLDKANLLAGKVDGERDQRGFLAHVRSYTPDPSDPQRIAVHQVLGGEPRTDWTMWPERNAILIGTQDMLLSRALNRGYGSGPARWPQAFGLLNNDCFWIFDEVQLMGSGVATGAQLHAFQEKLWRPKIGCRFVWMSATLGKDILRTRDRQDLEIPSPASLTLSDADKQRSKRRLRAQKSIGRLGGPPKPTKKDGSGVLDHVQPGRASLVVLNTVDSAQSTYRELQIECGKRAAKQKASPAQPELVLLHGRFRPPDRRRKLNIVLDFMRRQDPETGAADGHPGLLLVSTQVVEAGFDLSAARLWSEIAPWPSVIQRLGRLNREGAQPNAEALFWMPRHDKNRENSLDSPNAKRIGPYDKSDLDTAMRLLEDVEKRIKDGLAYRDALDDVLASDLSGNALKLDPDAVIRPDDLYGLFSTEADLAGGFTNISQFVRDQDRNADALVYWRDFDLHGGPFRSEPPLRYDELCAVPFYELARFLGDEGVAWEWSFERQEWDLKRKNEIFPGMTLLLARAQGGYSDELGWTGNSRDHPTVSEFELPSDIHVGGDVTPDGLSLDPASEGDRWLPLSQHLQDVESRAGEIAAHLAMDGAEAEAMAVAGRWHDWGKSLHRWQQAVRNHVARVIEKCDAILADGKLQRFHPLIQELRQRMIEPGGGQLWAKFPVISSAWTGKNLRNEDRKELKKRLYVRFNPGFRHEAASALAALHAWQHGERSLKALTVYLIASHHGKVRAVLRSTRKNDRAFGLLQSDELKPVLNVFSKALPLEFESMTFGATGSWDENDTSFTPAGTSWVGLVSELLGANGTRFIPTNETVPDSEPRDLGPFALAYFEALLQSADARASQWPGKGITA